MKYFKCNLRLKNMQLFDVPVILVILLQNIPDGVIGIFH